MGILDRIIGRVRNRGSQAASADGAALHAQLADAIRRGARADALALCDRILARAPDDQAALLAAGVNRLKTGAPAQAAAHFARLEALASGGANTARLVTESLMDPVRAGRGEPYVAALDEVLVDGEFWSVIDGERIYTQETQARSVSNSPRVRGRMTPDRNQCVITLPCAPQRIDAPCILLGSDAHWRPYVWARDDGTPAGVEVDLIARINALTGANIQLVLGDWSDMLERARRGELHGLAVSASHPERSDRSLFSVSPYSTHKYIFTRPNSRIARMEDLAGRSVGVLRGNMAELKLLRRWPDIRAVEIATPLELAVGLQKLARTPQPRIHLVLGDALALPLADASVDVVSIAFGLRNLPDYDAGVREMTRVLKPGGRLVVLEFLPPRGAALLAYRIYLGTVLPIAGRAISGSGEAYGYLSASIRGFMDGDEVRDLLAGAGLRRVESRRLSGGIASLYRGVKS